MAKTKTKNKNSNGTTNGNGGNGNGNGRRRRRRGGALGQIQAADNCRPVAVVSENRRKMNNAITRLKGSDFYSKVVVRADPSDAQRVLLELPVTPSGYPGTRITQLAALWERYVINSFRVRYVPAVPTTLACQLVLYIDTDPLDDPSGLPEAELVRQAVAQTGSQQWNFHVPMTIEMAMRADRQMYYTGKTEQNQRFNLAGKAFLIQLSNPINFNGEPLSADLEAGSIFIDWDISFQTPQINPYPVAPPVPIVVYSFIPNSSFSLYEFLELQPNAVYLVSPVGSSQSALPGANEVMEWAGADSGQSSGGFDYRVGDLSIYTVSANVGPIAFTCGESGGLPAVSNQKAFIQVRTDSNGNVQLARQAGSDQFTFNCFCLLMFVPGTFSELSHRTPRSLK